jgi:hypothetical protein
VSRPHLRAVTDPEAEMARRDRIVAAAEDLIRVYRRRARTHQHIALAELRPLRDAVDWNGDTT